MFEISKENEPRGKHVSVYSLGKMGKSTFIANAIKKAKNGLLILCGEDGISELGIENIPRIKKVFGEGNTVKAWEEFEELMKWLLVDPEAKKFTDIGFDGLNLIVNGCMRTYCIEKYFETKTKLDGTVKTKAEVAEEFGGNTLVNYQLAQWNKILESFNMLQKRGVNIWSTFHAQAIKWKAPDEEMDYDRWSIALPATKQNNLRLALINQCSFLLFGNLDTTVKKVGHTTKATGGNRVLHTLGDASYDAVARIGENYNGIPTTIPFNYDDFVKVFIKKEGKK